MPLLEAHGLTKRFGGLVAVNNVSFKIDEGEVVGLIGPNGAGKTTLFNLITGFYHPDSGKIIFQGRDITRLRPDQICRLGLTRTFQIVKPFLDLTTFDNVLIGALLETRDVSLAAKEADRVIDMLKLGRIRDTPARNLTTADRKLLEVARALATKPKLLLLDEVAAGLSLTEIGEIIDLLKSIHDQGITLCLVEHVMKFVMGISDRVIVLDRGAKIAEGSPSEVAADQAVIQAYLGVKYA